MQERKLSIHVDHVVKAYRLGMYNSRTFREEVQARRARRRGEADPRSKIGSNERLVGSTLYALNDVTMDIYEGESVGIIGMNGAGKSTLLKLISHISIPTSGWIGINGRISSMLEVGVGFMPEMTGKENLYLNGAILGMSTQEVTSKLDKIIEFSECGDFIDTPLKRYSSGMRVKLAFSIAAHLDNEIMIMDEVLAVGDQAFQQKCFQKMSEAAATEGKTVLYVSHNMATIRQLCSRCIVLNQGRVVFDGDTEQAIALYSQNYSRKACRIDLAAVARPAQFAPKVRMTQLRIPDRDYPAYMRCETLRMEVDWEALEAVDDACAFLRVATDDQTVIGVTYSREKCSARKGERHTAAIELDTSILGLGDYSLTLGFSQNYGGRGLDDLLDIARFCFTFEVQRADENDPFVVWSNRHDGHVVLPALSLSDHIAYTEEGERRL